MLTSAGRIGGAEIEKRHRLLEPWHWIGKRAFWEQWQMIDNRNPRVQELEECKERAMAHAERINQLAAELAEELKALKAIADEISPIYWQVYYKPFITGFHSISVPYVRSDGEVWTIFNRMV